MSRALRHLIAVICFALPVALVSCKPKIGQKCTTGKAVCMDSKTELACIGGVYAEVPCRGTAGCTANRSAVVCDNSIAQAGDGCDLEDDAACSIDKKAMLKCRSFKFTPVLSCKGAKSCQILGSNINCDDSVADDGDPCTKVKDAACGTDMKALLLCDGKKFNTTSKCRGPNGCRVVGTSIKCDTTVSVLGDQCGEEDSYACSSDKKQMLVCRAGKMKVSSFCRGPKSCYVQGNLVRCDKGYAVEDDPCAQAGAAACSLDGRAELQCVNERMVKTRRCPRGCTLNEVAKLIYCR